MREYAAALERLADGIEQAQNEYHQRMAAVAVTAAVGGLLTVVTATGSDEVAAAAISAELATATEFAAAAATQVVAVLTYWPGRRRRWRGGWRCWPA